MMFNFSTWCITSGIHRCANHANGVGMHWDS